MKKIILLQFLFILLCIGSVQSNNENLDRDSVLIFNDHLGYATYNSANNIITTSSYVEPDDTIYKDTATYSIPLWTLAKDSLSFLPGQRELVSILNRVACLKDAQLYCIYYLDPEVWHKSKIYIYGDVMHIVRKPLYRKDILGGLIIHNKLFVIMKDSHNYPRLLFDMFKETGEELKIRFNKIPIEGFTPTFLEMSQKVTGDLDSLTFKIDEMKLGPNQPIDYSKFR